MKKISGNTTGTFQIRTVTKNSIGTGVETWTDVLTAKGWLDLTTGETNRTTYNAKIQESTHMWFMDYQALNITAEKSRMIISSEIYDIVLIDDPMGMHEHLEIYLKYVGGQ